MKSMHSTLTLIVVSYLLIIVASTIYYSIYLFVREIQKKHLFIKFHEIENDNKYL